MEGVKKGNKAMIDLGMQSIVAVLNELRIRAERPNWNKPKESEADRREEDGAEAMKKQLEKDAIVMREELKKQVIEKGKELERREQLPLEREREVKKQMADMRKKLERREKLLLDKEKKMKEAEEAIRKREETEAIQMEADECGTSMAYGKVVREVKDMIKSLEGKVTGLAKEVEEIKRSKKIGGEVRGVPPPPPPSVRRKESSARPTTYAGVVRTGGPAPGPKRRERSSGKLQVPFTPKTAAVSP